jgi:oxazoline/thiazoline dehydrogenase
MGRLPLEDLACLLVRTSRVKSLAMSPEVGVQERTQRPTPSAGAIHPLDLVLIAHDVDGLPRGIWMFDPYSCDLIQESAIAPETVHGALETARNVGRLATTPPALIVLRANFMRTLARYPSGGALVWRDTGALLATLHLCAEDLGLASCILGTTGLLGGDRVDEGVIDTGALVVGSTLSS